MHRRSMVCWKSFSTGQLGKPCAWKERRQHKNTFALFHANAESTQMTAFRKQLFVSQHLYYCTHYSFHMRYPSVFFKHRGLFYVPKDWMSFLDARWREYNRPWASQLEARPPSPITSCSSKKGVLRRGTNVPSSLPVAETIWLRGSMLEPDLLASDLSKKGTTLWSGVNKDQPPS